MAILVASVAVAGDRFSDVPESNVFHDNVGWLADSGVTKGCNPPENTRYCPDRPVTRGELAAFLQRLSTNRVVDAGTVDGYDGSNLLSSIHGAVRETQGGTVNLIELPLNAGVVIQAKRIDAAEGSFALVTYGSVFYDADSSGVGVVVMWLQVDDATCDITEFASGAVVGSLLAAEISDSGLPTTVSGTVVLPTVGSPMLTMCAAELNGNQGVMAATSQLNSLHVGTGATTASSPQGSVTGSGLTSGIDPASN